MINSLMRQTHHPQRNSIANVLSHKSVNVTIMGLRDIERFHRVAKALSEQETLTSEAKTAMETYGARMLQKGKL